MPSAGSPTKLLRCPGCGATLSVPIGQIGKTCRCGGCGTVFRPQSPKPAPDRLVSFNCLLCDTRLTVSAKLVGRRVVCPDCGTKNTVPSPPPEPKPKIPPAMHGQQYGVWGVDEGPLPSEIAKRHPKYFPVYCRLCDTLMHATPAQVGQMIDCPDCGTKTVVPPPPKPKPERAAVPDGEEYQLDESSAPTPRPAPAVVERLAEQEKQAAVSPGPGERPPVPPVPLVVGVAGMLVRSPVPGWWFSLSLWLMVIIFLLSQAVVPIASQFQGIFAVACLAASCILGSLWFGAFSAVVCSVLQESSDGADRLVSPPRPVFYDWFTPAAYLFVSLAASTLPGWGVGAIAYRFGYDLRLVAPLVGVGLAFPVMFLSALERGAVMDVFGPKVWGSLLWRPGHWLLFYMEVALCWAPLVGRPGCTCWATCGRWPR